MIPDWNGFGVLPPILPGEDGAASHGRSPYRVSLLDLVDRFSTNDSRMICLRGFFNKMKSEHHVDVYGTRLDIPMDANIIKLISYWYSVWSHRRDHLWKGFIEVSLNPDEDQSALSALDSIIERQGREGGPRA